jgi:hypothetical protein
LVSGWLSWHGKNLIKFTFYQEDRIIYPVSDGSEKNGTEIVWYTRQKDLLLKLDPGGLVTDSILGRRWSGQ